jgi:8-amino-7-oxononanoate synthase
MQDQRHLEAEELPGRTLRLNGEEHLYFSGTSYLGIARDPRFRQLLEEGMDRYGTNYSSSRLSNLQIRVYEEAESQLARYTGAGAALTMSAGYLTCQMVVRQLEGSGRFLYAPGTHPALWLQPEGYADEAYEKWVKRVRQEVAEGPDEHLILVSNSLDPLYARRFDFDWVAGLPKNKQLTLLVDDSHGFGITGPEGAGIYPALHAMLQHLPHVRLVVVTSFGKALGIPGGIILSNEQLIQRLKESPFFGGASPIIPAYLHAYLHARPLFAEAREKLGINVRLFTEQLAQPARFSSFNDYPVFYTPHAALGSYLLSHRVLISSFPYPTPSDPIITRVVLNSLHTAEDISRLTRLINQFDFQSTGE